LGLIKDWTLYNRSTSKPKSSSVPIKSSSQYPAYPIHHVLICPDDEKWSFWKDHLVHMEHAKWD
jgi:hypothetical protein